MNGLKGIEAIFGGILALIVLGAAIYLVFSANFPPGPQTTTPPILALPDAGSGVVPASAEDVYCQCYDQGYDLAGADVGVMSSQYRTGFESCRAVGGPKGGDAWTAGWNARLSSGSFGASCRGWLRRSI